VVAGALTRSPSSPSAFPRRPLLGNLVNRGNPPPSALQAQALHRCAGLLSCKDGVGQVGTAVQGRESSNDSRQSWGRRRCEPS
jgi:hypothetical protein